MFSDVLENPAQAYLRPVQIIGGIGTGKTSTTIRFGESLESKAREKKVNLKHVYANLKLQGSGRTVLYRYLLEKASPEIRTTSLSGDEMLYQLVKYLNSNNMYLMISLDEIEYFMKHASEHIIYDLTRINELSPEKPCGVVGLIIISRGTDYYNLLEKSEISTLGRNYISFPQYSALQIRDILLARSAEAFRKGAVSNDVIEFIANVSADPPVNGDVRYALDLLLYAGNLADNRGSETVALDHVRLVHGKVYHEITSQDILDLPNDEKIVLLALARALRRKKSAYVSFEEIRSNCALLAEELKIKVENIDYAIQDMGDKGIVNVKSIVQIGISDVPTEDLIAYINSIIDRVRSDLNEG